jgi:hypothetical protein
LKGGYIKKDTGYAGVRQSVNIREPLRLSPERGLHLP